MASENTNKNSISNMSDQELVQAYECTADPMAIEQLKAEERRRNSDRALKQATKSNKIAIASLAVATLSLIVAIMALAKGS